MQVDSSHCHGVSRLRVCLVLPMRTWSIACYVPPPGSRPRRSKSASRSGRGSTPRSSTLSSFKRTESLTLLLRELRFELGKLLLKLRNPLRELPGERGSWLSRACGLRGRLQEHRQIVIYLRLSERLRRDSRLLRRPGRGIRPGRWGRDGRRVGCHVHVAGRGSLHVWPTARPHRAQPRPSSGYSHRSHFRTNTGWIVRHRDVETRTAERVSTCVEEGRAIRIVTAC